MPVFRIRYCHKCEVTFDLLCARFVRIIAQHGFQINISLRRESIACGVTLGRYGAAKFIRPATGFAASWAEPANTVTMVRLSLAGSYVRSCSRGRVQGFYDATGGALSHWGPTCRREPSPPARLPVETTHTGPDRRLASDQKKGRLAHGA